MKKLQIRKMCVHTVATFFILLFDTPIIYVVLRKKFSKETVVLSRWESITRYFGHHKEFKGFKVFKAFKLFTVVNLCYLPK